MDNFEKAFPNVLLSLASTITGKLGHLHYLYFVFFLVLFVCLHIEFGEIILNKRAISVMIFCNNFS